MTRGFLQNKKILLTRPGGVSDFLRDSISDAGGEPLYLPSMRITALEEDSLSKQVLGKITDFDILIFVSRNAVKYAQASLAELSNLVLSKVVIAIGKGTHAELSELGISEVKSVDSNNGSAALLNMPELSSENLGNKKVMILRGLGGRELLNTELTKRGAKIEYVELYRRAKPQIEASTISSIWLQKKPDIVSITSAEGLENLLEMSETKERSQFLNTPLVVISPRLKSVAKSAGFRAEIKVANGYSDEDFMIALKEIFEVIENE
jgi:uroporphyrinogen-III synthase